MSLNYFIEWRGGPDFLAPVMEVFESVEVVFVDERLPESRKDDLFCRR